jgi:DNA-binding response OmpR family regulator
MHTLSQDEYILVVEDDEGLARSIADWLTLEGFATKVARDGLEGLRMAKQHSPDLVLADVAMPHIDGIRLSRELRELGIPVILISAAAERDRLPLDVPFFRKPFDIEELGQAIEGLLNTPAEPAPEEPPER